MQKRMGDKAKRVCGYGHVGKRRHDHPVSINFLHRYIPFSFIPFSVLFFLVLQPPIGDDM